MDRRILVLLIGLVLICGLVGCDQEPRMITVTFDANGAIGDVPPSITVSCYDEIVVPTQGSLHKDGYYFTGWYSSRDNYARYKSGDKNQFMYNELLYACWEEGCSDNVFGYSDETKTEIAYLCDRTASHYSIPYGVVRIGSEVFEGCSGISSIQIPDSVTEIEWNAFKGCTGLSELVLPYNLEKIGNCSFEDCNGLTSIRVPESVESIGAYAFKGCSALSSITIPKTITSIGYEIFDQCSNLVDVRYNSTIEDWNAISEGWDWGYGTPSYTIHCTDGDISK